MTEENINELIDQMTDINDKLSQLEKNTYCLEEISTNTGRIASAFESLVNILEEN